MKYPLIIFFLLILSPIAYSQDTLKMDNAGLRLQRFLLSLDVENNWIAGHHVDWQTGKPDMPESKHGVKTHCSAFAAAACQQANIYLLRPPEHSQILLASAQADWLASNKARKEGWQKLDGADHYLRAQQLANEGKMVIAVIKNPDPHEPGHAAIVMPRNRTTQQITEGGPEIIMAGTHNHNYISLKNGFKSHITAWPEDEIKFYVHDILPTQ